MRAHMRVRWKCAALGIIRGWVHWMVFIVLCQHFHYLIFSFLSSGVEVQRGVEFRHSSRNPELGEKLAAEFLNIRLPMQTRVKAWSWKKKHFHVTNRYRIEVIDWGLLFVFWGFRTSKWENWIFIGSLCCRLSVCQDHLHLCRVEVSCWKMKYYYNIT